MDPGISQGSLNLSLDEPGLGLKVPGLLFPPPQRPRGLVGLYQTMGPEWLWPFSACKTRLLTCLSYRQCWGPRGKPAYPDSTFPDESMWTHCLNLTVLQEMAAGDFQCWKKTCQKGMARWGTTPETESDGPRRTGGKLHWAPLERAPDPAPTRWPVQCLCASLPNKPKRFWSIRQSNCLQWTPI